MRNRHILMLLAATMMVPVASPAWANDAALTNEIAALKAQLAQQAAQLAAQAAQLERLERATTVLTQNEAETSAKIAALPATPSPALAPQLADADGPATTIGGYGEIHYNGYLKDKSRNQADLRRFVVSFGHRFTDRLSLVSELEVEHAVTSGGGDPGEVALEQAYLNYRFSPAVNVKAGLFLLPFGFLNRNHEPPAFYGVERNEVETRIIPTTLREGGIGIYGTTKFGLSYDFGLTTGYSIDKFDDASAPLAAVHQELAEAKAANLSLYAGLEYKGVPGLTLGAAISSGNSSQANATFKSDPTAADLSGIKARVTLWDVHARYQIAGFDVRGLYARGTISNAGRINQAFAAVGGPGSPVVPSAFYGWFVEGAYTFGLGGDVSLSPFARYERYDTQSKLAAGLIADPANRDKVFTTGLSFKPFPDVVLKADYQTFIDHGENDRINFGIGYQF
jgi:hypothetical protein